jgi:hypothetical protein
MYEFACELDDGSSSSLGKAEEEFAAMGKYFLPATIVVRDG